MAIYYVAHRYGGDPANIEQAKKLPYHLGNAVKYISRAGKK